MTNWYDSWWPIVRALLTRVREDPLLRELTQEAAREQPYSWDFLATYGAPPRAEDWGVQAHFALTGFDLREPNPGIRTIMESLAGARFGGADSTQWERYHRPSLNHLFVAPYVEWLVTLLERYMAAKNFIDIPFDTTQLVADWEDRVRRTVYAQGLKVDGVEMMRAPRGVVVYVIINGKDNPWNKAAVRKVDFEIREQLLSAWNEHFPSSKTVTFGSVTIHNSGQVAFGDNATQTMNLNPDAVNLVDTLVGALKQMNLGEDEEEVASTAVERMAKADTPAKWLKWAETLVNTVGAAKENAPAVIDTLQRWAAKLGIHNLPFLS